jgi:hypothetical protein
MLIQLPADLPDTCVHSSTGTIPMMLVVSCIAIGIVCLAAIARRAVDDSQTNASFFAPIRNIIKPERNKNS